MGNKNQANRSNNTAPKNPGQRSSFFDIKKIAKRRKNTQKDDFLKLCEPSIFYGQCIQVEPEENNYEIKCIFCQTLNFDDGLEIPTRCSYCNSIYIAKDNGVQKYSGDFYDNLIQSSLFKTIQTKKLKELNHLILYCNSKTLPNELLNENKIDYTTIIQKIILPFFSIKSRVVRFGVIFKIGNFEFKAVACEPISGGKITKHTRIHCYKEYNSCQNLESVKLCLKGNKKSNPSSTEILNFFKKNNKDLHLSIDQNLLYNNIDLNVISATPSNGMVTKETKIELMADNLKQISSMQVICCTKTFKKIQHNPKIKKAQDIEEIIYGNYLQPYFEGFSRYIKQGMYLSLEDPEDFLIKECKPFSGFVSSKTQIKIILKENYSNFNSHPNNNHTENMQLEALDGSKKTKQLFKSKNNTEEENKNDEEDDDDEEEEIENDNEDEEEKNEDGEDEEDDEEEDVEEEKENTFQQHSTNNIIGRPELTNSRTFHSFPLQNPNSTREIPQNRSTHPTNFDFMESFNDDSESNESSSNFNSDHSIPLESANQNRISQNTNENSSVNANETSEEERLRIRLRAIRYPHLTHLRVFSDHSQNEEINNAIQRVLNAFLLFNEPFMQSMLDNERRGNLNIFSSSNPGATKFQINRLPERIISKAFIEEKRNIEENLIKCMICLNEYEDQDCVRTMPCLHYFHKDCLDVWLLKCKTCPICKTACDINEKEIVNFEG